jgi:hypothetical protein
MDPAPIDQPPAVAGTSRHGKANNSNALAAAAVAFPLGRYATLYHVVAWGVPAAFFLAAMVAGHVDGDPLTGMCVVGAQSERNLLAYVLVPQTVLLAIGSAVLAVGGFYANSRKKKLRTLAATATDLVSKTPNKQSEVSFVQNLMYIHNSKLSLFTY